MKFEYIEFLNCSYLQFWRYECYLPNLPNSSIWPIPIVPTTYLLTDAAQFKNPQIEAHIFNIGPRALAPSVRSRSSAFTRRGGPRTLKRLVAACLI